MKILGGEWRRGTRSVSRGCWVNPKRKLHLICMVGKFRRDQKRNSWWRMVELTDERDWQTQWSARGETAREVMIAFLSRRLL